MRSLVIFCRGVRACFLFGFAAAFFFEALALSARGQTLDTLTFGNNVSENAHSLNYSYSDTIASGGLGQTARRLLPKPLNDVYGGEMVFTMAVDPVKQNYFTIKLWGSDTNDSQQWLVLNINGLELGDRHGTFSGEDPLWFQGVSWYTNCFIYRTMALPLHLTRGKTSMTLKIRSLGWISYYDSGPYFNHYQKLMDAPTVGIYRAYTHTGSIVDTTVEAQGAAPMLPTPRALENETTTLNAVKTNVNNSLSSKLNATASSLSVDDIQFLAQCYDAKENLGESWIAYPSGLTKTNLINQVIAAVDSEATAQSTNSSYVGQQGNSSWGGYFGTMGDAIRIMWPQLSNSMSASVSFSGTYGMATRQRGWSQALRASVDSGRYNRQNIGNQSLANADHIYLANSGLLLVEPTNALNETEARRYIKEASGILPWMGNDQTGGGQVPIYGTMPYGTNWFMCTTKGTSKDGNGFVGDDYGNLGPWIYRLGVVSGDSQILARGVVMTRARDVFRFPAPDQNGYLVMQGTEPIGERNNGLPGHYVYLGRTFSDDFVMAAQGIGSIGADLVGNFQQEMNDGQLFQMISGYADPYLPLRYNTIKSFPQMGIKLPMSVGAADFAWADEENMVFAAKHGEERIFANLFWRQPDWINALAKVFYLTTNQARLADVLSVDQRFNASGAMTVLGPGVEQFSYDTPPDNPINAYNGVPALVALRSDLTNAPPSNRDGGRGTGYTFRFGNWLVGINSHYTSNYVMQLPAGFTSATNMIDGSVLAAPVTLAPKTTAVFYLPTNVDAAPLPSRSLFIMANGANARVVVSWTHAGGATAYNLKRSTTSGGGYTTVASAATNNFYTDTSVVNGTTYYYVVSSTNSIGESGNSPEDSATPLAPQTVGLAAPWANTNIGAAGGSASISSGTFTLTSAQGDIYGTIDGCQVLYQPMIGDGIITARVQSQTSGNTYAKCGVMIRDSLATNTIEASMNLEANAGRGEFDYRTSYGGGMNNFTGGSGVTLPYWVRLVRSGSVITGYISPNGTNWTKIGNVTLSGLGYVAYVGLDTSPANGSAGQQNTSVFNNVNFPLGATTAPSTPNNLSAGGGNTFATLLWSSVSNAVTYNLKRGTIGSGPFTTVATGLINPSATDYGLTNGVNYFYVVTAVNDAGESTNSNVATVLSSPPPSVPVAVVGNSSNALVTLAWSATANATGYNIYRATYNAQDPQFSLFAANVSGTNWTDTNVVNLSPYFYYVTSLTNGSESQWSLQAAAEPPGVSAPWSAVDIGNPNPAGYSFQNGTNFSINAGGSDIYGNSDMFRYVYQPANSSNIVITARVATLNSVDQWTKTGVMIRQSTAANSAQATLIISPNNGIHFQYRTSNGGGSADAGSFSAVAPYWLRLAKTNSTFIAYRSTDNITWTQVGSAVTISMPVSVLVGLPLTAHADGFSANVLMDSVSISVPPPGVPTNLIATAGNAQISLKWNVSTNSIGYNLKRSLVSGSGYTTIAGLLTVTNFTDTGLVNGTQYFYVVNGTNAVGESANSSSASAIPLSSAATSISFVFTNGQFQINWPSDHIGWVLQAQTNSLATGLGPNWVNVPNSNTNNQFSITLNPVDGGVFFRLAHP
jgi:fibronectin type 3 domain-containing protein